MNELHLFVSGALYPNPLILSLDKGRNRLVRRLLASQESLDFPVANGSLKGQNLGMSPIPFFCSSLGCEAEIPGEFRLSFSDMV
ncbi:MAG: hypothetical protein ACYDEO_19370 [Aggregatilineales bacterium]